MTAVEIETAIANKFNFRQNLIVPNLHWSLFRYELDMLIIRKSGFGIEVEIKVSKADLKKDATKRNCHNDKRIRELYFAVPEHLYEACLEFCPVDAGIILVGYEDYWQGGKRLSTFLKRPAIVRKEAVKFTDKEINYIARLGCMRVWKLKQKLTEAKP